MKYLKMKTGELGTVLSENNKWVYNRNAKNSTRNWKKWKNQRQTSKRLIQLEKETWQQIYDDGTPITIAFRTKKEEKIYYGEKNKQLIVTNRTKALKKILKNEFKRVNCKIKEKQKREKDYFNLIPKKENLFVSLKKIERW